MFGKTEHVSINERDSAWADAYLSKTELESSRTLISHTPVASCSEPTPSDLRLYTCNILEFNFGAGRFSPARLVKMAGWWRQRREEVASGSSVSFYIPSPVEGRESQEAIDERVARAKHCTDEGVKAGFKAATIACVASAVPTLTAVRTVPWFKTNLNYTGQALIISAATIATYFIVTDQTIHECSRKGSYDALVKRRSGVS